MLYVLKNVGLGAGTIPEIVESFYDEVVVVKNDIALVQHEHVKDSMLGMGYAEIGTVDAEADVKKLFESPDTEARIRKDDKRVVNLGDMAKEPEGATRSWYQNLE